MSGRSGNYTNFYSAVDKYRLKREEGSEVKQRFAEVEVFVRTCARTTTAMQLSKFPCR